MTGCTGSNMIVQGESPTRETLDRNQNIMDPKKTIKIGAWNVLSTRSSRLKEQTQKDYAEKDKEVKKRARKDKTNHLEERAEEAEKTAARGDLSTVYKITKELCGQSKQPPPVKDNNGKIITTEREQAARWVEHFKAVLNRPEPINDFRSTPT
ncbi:unnamed protein product [Mytilus edulis]|uniref:Uncharacterized protein n=1 Tax=Mytilus edulis TaxID=6550 RepID=A0A8S3TA63_MYTED|nr:unnamed protein product [Mytilus edulis]